MGDVGRVTRGYRPSLAWGRAAPLAISGNDANAIRGIAIGCVISALLWAGLGALVRAALG